MSDTSLVPARTPEQLTEVARHLRLETVRLIGVAKTGHYASAFSCAEILAVLYYGGVMRIRVGDHEWPERDRFLFGKGHAAIAQYPILADLEYFPTEWLDEYTRLGNALGDHPDMTRVPGVDFSSGSLGHALSVGLGMCLQNAATGRDSRAFVMLGDGELNEGQVWEAAMHASHHRVGRLVAIVDRNGYSLDGQVDDVMGVEPLRERWEAFGWDVEEVDGHDVEALQELLVNARIRPVDGKPLVVIARTVKGKGIPYMENEFGWHLGWLNDEDQAAAERILASDGSAN